MKLNRKAFTLMELLIGVLIIGILAAVAVPQYQKAILKSRYSAMMPIGKAVADGNEVYYMEHGNYASDLKVLSVQGQAEYPDGTKLEFGDTDDYAYVLASNTDKTPHNTYVVYQKHSKNFPDNIHCEAFDQDEKATWLCRDGLHGTKIETGEIKSLSGEGYSAYLLSGSTTGSTFDKSCEGEAATITQTCPGGCGKISGTATCNPYTGEWEAPTLDESSCPAKPEDETASCSTGDGQKTRSAKCNADGTAWEWDNWDESACCTGTPPSATNASYIRCTGSNTGTTPICVNGQWQFTSFSSDLVCGEKYAYCTPAYSGASNGGPCTGTYVVSRCYGNKEFACTNSEFIGEKVRRSGYTASCYGDAEYACANSTFRVSDTEFHSGAICSGNSSYACANSTFIGSHPMDGFSNVGQVACTGNEANACSGSTFKSGAVCEANVPGACDNTQYDGGCCKSSNGYCPTGSPKCVSNSTGRVTIQGTW